MTSADGLIHPVMLNIPNWPLALVFHELVIIRLITFNKEKLITPISTAATSPTVSGFRPSSLNRVRLVPRPTAAMAMEIHHPARNVAPSTR